MSEIKRAIETIKQVSDLDTKLHLNISNYDLLTAIEALQEKQDNRWVPVSETPPKYDGEYLCTVKTKSGFKGISPDIIQVVTMVWVSNNWKNQWFQVVLFYVVLAWKPLPEVYEEGENDG